jgi:hypothetical protein
VGCDQTRKNKKKKKRKKKNLDSSVGGVLDGLKEVVKHGIESDSEGAIDDATFGIEERERGEESEILKERKKRKKGSKERERRR